MMLSSSQDPSMNLWNMTAGPMTPVTPQWQGWVNDQTLTRSVPANPERMQVQGVLPQTLFLGQTHQPSASQSNQGLNMAPTEKADSRVQTSSGCPSSNQSTPVKEPVNPAPPKR